MDAEVVAAVIGAAAGVAAGILGTLGTLWLNKRTRRSELQDKKWDEVFLSLDRIEQLTAEHIRKIGDVVKPLLRTGDLPETCERYDAFVNDPALPTGYGGARGVLLEAYGSGEFRNQPVREKLKSVIQQLHDFQHMGFLLKQSSWAIADSMDHALNLYKELLTRTSEDPQRVPQLANHVRGEFENALGDIRASIESRVESDYYIEAERPVELRTNDDLVQLIKAFCREWQRSAEITLYGRRGLHHAIGELKFALRDANE